MDLVGTKFNNKVSLTGLICKSATTWWGKSLDSKDAERFGRLKEIAEENKNHIQALRFHAQEMNSSITLTGLLGIG